MAFQQKSETDPLENQLRMGQSALLSVVILTLVNLILYLLDSGYYMLFSASVPYYVTVLGTEMGYAVYYSIWNPYTYIGLGISAVILLLYLLCWLQSRHKPRWLTVGLVLFVLDTLCLVGMTVFLFDSAAESIMDYILHALILYELTKGVIAVKKMDKQATRPGTPEL